MSAEAKVVGHTPGAMRAADRIHDRHRYASKEWLAEVIDRETAAPDLLDALRLAWDNIGTPAAERSARGVDAVILAAIARATEG